MKLLSSFDCGFDCVSPGHVPVTTQKNHFCTSTNNPCKKNYEYFWSIVK